MPNAVKGQLAKLGAALQSFTVAQRTIAVILVAALVLGVVALVSWLGKPTYTPLFSGIDPTDASAIVELLQTDGVPYELTAGGGTILVPENVVYDERLKAAAAGLPAASSGGGYSLLDTMGVTSSEFQQNVTYKRAIEGELANTIKAMDGVKNASVQLAIPEESVFVAEQRDPTASVFVETQAGATLDSKQVQAIVNLTSASVDGMKATDVAVTDASGTVLSAVGSGAVGGAGGDASDYESKVQASVQAMLDKMVGPGNSSVVVAADLDQSSGTKVTESFSQPTSGPIALNESGTTEQYGSGADGANGTGATGVLGPDNIAVPNGTAADGTTTAGTGADGGYTNESTTKNNAVDKVTESLNVPAPASTPPVATPSRSRRSTSTPRPRTPPPRRSRPPTRRVRARPCGAPSARSASSRPSRSPPSWGSSSSPVAAAARTARTSTSVSSPRRTVPRPGTPRCRCRSTTPSPPRG